MSYLLAGGIALVIALIALRHFVKAPPSELARAIRTFVGIFGALSSTGLLLAGRIGIAVIIVVATIMTIRSMRANAFGEPADDATSASQVRTAYLDMQLDTVTQTMDGIVLAGQQTGQRLSNLGLNSVLELLREVARDDPQSTPLVEAYLDFQWPEWRDDPSWSGYQDGTAASASDDMNDERALRILGLDEHASVEDIKRAHRRLLAQLHPDHGGSDYLAAQINEAKSHLLRSRGSR